MFHPTPRRRRKKKEKEKKPQTLSKKTTPNPKT
jgi:hypothetical protein